MHHCATHAYVSLIADLKEPLLLNHVTFSDVHLRVYPKTDGIWAHCTQVESALSPILLHGVDLTYFLTAPISIG
jgi:hypothetical protein